MEDSMSNQRLIETSKFLSYVLRHEPQAIGIALDSEGWVEITTLIAGAARHGRELNEHLIREVVVGNDKKRFSLSPDGTRIRAAQGHSSAHPKSTARTLVPWYSCPFSGIDTKERFDSRLTPPRSSF